MIKVLCVFGTRPEAIKMAPLVKELAKYPNEIISKVAVTAQHREMLDQVLDLFAIKPDYDLDIMHNQQTLTQITTRALEGLDKVYEEEKPNLVLVHGDTTTTCVASLGAFYRQIAIGHVEAGLRTGNKYSPFPEEMNRKITGAIADFHFAPTTTAKENLLRENIAPEAITVTGNTVIDALLATVQESFPLAQVPGLDKVDFTKRVILVTAHRRENLGEPMRQIFNGLREIALEFPETEIVFPVHKNPKVRSVVHEVLGNLPQVHLIEPLDYQPFVNLMARADLVLTDSGGLQEEAPALGKPVLVLRDTTERPEAVEAGTVSLVGTGFDGVYAETKRLLTDPLYYEKMANAVNPYGDGKAAQRIVQSIRYIFKLSTEKCREYI
ncbi:UDP-N-acetylglucosamine 2-epimerase (non-hydrolyzing) [Bacillota bacterium LX-D]|nr:UDP-N-acetylglucosamine 2-epimerase (non-hydrolyzing) [Bacillota bacterium LX-D]